MKSVISDSALAGWIYQDWIYLSWYSYGRSTESLKRCKIINMPGWPRNIFSLNWNDNILPKYWHIHLNCVQTCVIPALSISTIWNSNPDAYLWWRSCEKHFSPQRNVGIIVACFSYPGFFLMSKTNSEWLSLSLLLTGDFIFGIFFFF